MSEENKKNTLSEGEFSRKKILERLKENLEKHNDFYESAVETYWKLAEEKLEELEFNYFKGYRKLKKDVNKKIGECKKNIKSQNDFSYYLPKVVCYPDLDLPPKPKSYADKYQKIIEWLDLSESDTIVLNDSEFDNYIMDNWDFKEEMKQYGLGLISGCQLSTGFLSTSASIYNHTGANGYLKFSV